jgi:hypothetical protein
MVSVNNITNINKSNKPPHTLKVDSYSGCDSNEIVTMEKRYCCEIIAFLSRRYYRF